MKHPETAALAKAAFESSGCKTQTAFAALFGDALGLRTFRAWIVGEVPAAPMAQLMLREFVAGWRPSQARP